MTDPTPLTIQQIVARYQSELAAGDTAASQRLSTSYLRAFERLEAQQAALLADIEADRARGIEPTRGKIIRSRRYQSLLRQTQEELDRFAVIIEDDARNGATTGATAGAQLAQELVQGSLAGLPPEVQASIMATFDQLPTDAVEALVGALQEGSPLFDTTLSRYGTQHAANIGQALIDNVLQGKNPRVTARQMTTQWGIPLTDALRISRTEHNRAGRTATVATYRRNPHLVKGWRWMSALDKRTCLSCINLHGTLHPLTETIDDHPNGRCTAVPEMVSWADLGIDLPEPDLGIEEGAGEAWFAQQDAETQRAMMGPGKLAAWEAGEFAFSQLSKETSTPRWGRMFSEAPLKDLVGGRTAGPTQTTAQWKQSLTVMETESLRSYQTTGYREYNDALRGNLESWPELQAEIDAVERGISKGVLGQDTTVFRGGSAQRLLAHGPDTDRLVGLVIEDKAFLSTSADKEQGRKFTAFALEENPTGALWEIRVPRGTRVADMRIFDASEGELLFGPGTQLRIVEVRKEKMSYEPWGAEFMDRDILRVIADLVP